MGWFDKIQNGIKIVTGDGKEYKPLYVITPKTVEYNLATFEFPDIPGTLAIRSQPKGGRYSIEIAFSGDDCIDTMLAFERSNHDSRPWEVTHPVYGKHSVQPGSLTYDPTGLSICKISGEVIVTIKDDAPRMSINPPDKIAADVVKTKEVAAVSFGSNVTPSTSDVATMQQNTAKTYNLGAKSIKSGIQSNEYFDMFTKASNAITSATSYPGIAATYIMDLLVYPSLFKSSVQDRLLLLKAQYDALSNSIQNLTGKNEKSIYELQAGAIVTGMVNACANPESGDYTDVDSVNGVIDSVLSVYNSYIFNLDSIQTDNAGDVDSYVPNYNSVSVLSDLVGYTLSQLLGIAISSKQKRTFILEADSNLILLTHRVYGISPDQATIDQFMMQNNIGLNEILQIEKGRTIVYFV